MPVIGYGTPYPEMYPTFLTAEAVGGHRVVRLSDAGVLHATSSRLADAGLVIGMTTQAVGPALRVPVVMNGNLLENVSWGWDEGPVYVGLDGVPTQTPPADGFVQCIGTALSAILLYINVEPAVIRAQ